MAELNDDNKDDSRKFVSQIVSQDSVLSAIQSQLMLDDGYKGLSFELNLINFKLNFSPSLPSKCYFGEMKM